MLRSLDIFRAYSHTRRPTINTIHRCASFAVKLYSNFTQLCNANGRTLLIATAVLWRCCRASCPHLLLVRAAPHLGSFSIYHSTRGSSQTTSSRGAHLYYIHIVVVVIAAPSLSIGEQTWLRFFFLQSRAMVWSEFHVFKKHAKPQPPSHIYIHATVLRNKCICGSKGGSAM